MTAHIVSKTGRKVLNHIEHSFLDGRVFAFDAGEASFVRRKKACSPDTYSDTLCLSSFLGDIVIRRNAM